MSKAELEKMLRLYLEKIGDRRDTHAGFYGRDGNTVSYGVMTAYESVIEDLNEILQGAWQPDEPEF